MITEYVLPGDAVFPEGIAEDPNGVTFYVSSENGGAVFRGRTDAPELEAWLPAGADGRTQALGTAPGGCWSAAERRGTCSPTARQPAS